jgi:signal peptidase II
VPRQRVTRGVNVTVVVVALAVTIADFLTKLWAHHALAHRSVHVVGPVWLRLAYNTGISFSLNRSGPLGTTVVVLLIVVVVAVVALRAAPGIATVGFGLLLGGGLGNEINRLVQVPHRVTDFIAVGSFPVFNVADTGVTLGCAVLVIALLRDQPLVQR